MGKVETLRATSLLGGLDYLPATQGRGSILLCSTLCYRPFREPDRIERGPFGGLRAGKGAARPWMRA